MLICKRMKCFLLVSDTNEYSYDKLISCRPSKRQNAVSSTPQTSTLHTRGSWIHGSITLA